MRTARDYVAGVIDEDVFPYTVMTVYYGHGPHLATKEVQTFDHRIGETIESDGVRAARVVGCVFLLFDPLVPVVAVSIEGADAMAIDTDVVPTEHECGGLVLVSIWNGCVEPVLNVCTPLWKKLVDGDLLLKANVRAALLGHRSRHPPVR